jgi:hypothetical protein
MTITAQESVERGFERDKRDYWAMRAARVEINGSIYNAIVEPVAERERLVGRDVLNQTKVTFDVD